MLEFSMQQQRLPGDQSCPWGSKCFFVGSTDQGRNLKRAKNTTEQIQCRNAARLIQSLHYISRQLTWLCKLICSVSLLLFPWFGVGGFYKSRDLPHLFVLYWKSQWMYPWSQKDSSHPEKTKKANCTSFVLKELWEMKWV